MSTVVAPALPPPIDSLVARIGGVHLTCTANDDLPLDAAGSEGSECVIDNLGMHLAGTPDLLLIQGHPTLLHLVAAAEAMSGHPEAIKRTSVLVIEGPPRGLAPDAQLPAVGAALRRQRTASELLRRGAVSVSLAGGISRPLLWLSGTPSVGLVVAPAARDQLGALLDISGAVLASLEAAVIESSDRTLDAIALQADLERAQVAGERLVTSTRFRIGTRVTRAGRKIVRRHETFRAPREILARRASVDSWRERLTSLRPPAAEAIPKDAVRIRFLLPEFRLSGGVLDVAEFVDEMRVLGADAQIDTLRIRADTFELPLLALPRLHSSPDALVGDLEQCDIVVATHWRTAEWAVGAVRTGRASRAAAYLQDYEPWFVDEGDPRARDRVRDAFALIDDRMVISHWLSDLLEADGLPSTVIPPGLDLGVFAPRDIPHDHRTDVIAMARPRTPRRGFETLVTTLEYVHRRRPRSRIVLFGEKLGATPLPFPCRRLGVITDQDELARHLSSARVHYDASDYQAFGRTALEAMACGTPSVLTEVGGVHEYARHGENALLVPPRDPGAAADAILEFLEDDTAAGNAAAAGLAEIPRHSMRRRARAMLAHLTQDRSFSSSVPLDPDKSSEST